MTPRLEPRGELAPSGEELHIRPHAPPIELPVTTDGRNIDQRLGVLEGEAATIRSRVPSAALALGPETLAKLTTATPGASRTYYEQPVIKRPPWKGWIPTYFFVGGAAGSAAALGAAAQVAGGRRLRPIVMPARWLAAVGLAVGAGLLVADLGRPARFFNMLRVFRPTSPMNVGTWILTTAGASAGASAVLPLLGARRLGDGAGLVAGVSGLALTSYTAVLIAATAAPAWQHGAETLPLLLTASAAASGGSALALLVRRGPPAATIARFANVAKLAELAMAVAYERELASAGEVVVRHLRAGRAGLLSKIARAATLASIVLSLVPGRSRTTRAASALLGLGGALASRFAVMDAGRASALDPRATFEPQRRARASRLERTADAGRRIATTTAGRARAGVLLTS